ncbi:MAG: tetratricopeptide repeat protein [Olsenella sp.]|jgi:tetratricopeptide (TPR) repeat protein|nr:tetratricopeptide repeat protein [Olsenella sp.]MCI1792607.1 tetratricopeptide repeat protein [Olsenella sp.]MCI1812374.1 tetratricopeptide repeat protein [Olsenella sp.]MCI1880188.1 tetratricopeptide repeat protein [Olsenella sp.]
MEETDNERWPHWAHDFTQALSHAFGRQPSGTDQLPTSLSDSENSAAGQSLGARFAAAVNAENPRVTSTLDIDVLSQRLMTSDDPLSDLGLVVADVRSREQDVGGKGATSIIAPNSSNQGALPPSNLEVFLADSLDDAGLLAPDVAIPSVSAVRPHTSHLFYLRVNDPELSYAAKLKVLGIEAALNAALLASTFFEDADDVPMEELVRFRQRVATSVTSQIPTIADGLPTREEERPNGEWAVRKGISTGIEHFQVPYRLQASFRTNVADGDVAFVVDLTPPSVMPAHVWVDGVGIVSATPEMRRRAATDYNLRVGILLAACAFRCSSLIQRVWVAGSVDTPQSHDCYYSVRFDREGFSKIPLTGTFDPVETYRSFAAVLDEHDGQLSPVRQDFSLESERFCPARRYETVELSKRVLADPFATALGAHRVAQLGIVEESKRIEVASQISRHLTSSTEGNVRAIMELAGNDDDATVREAARRCATKLIDGAIAEDDPQAIQDEFVNGDALTIAVEKAKEQLSQKDAEGALSVTLGALEPLELAHAYEDTPAVEWRAFGSYVDRALYNRLLWDGSRETRLVPDAYLEAQLVVSVAALAQGQRSMATERARRAVEIAPLSIHSRLQLAQCLDTEGRSDDAMAEVGHLLELAHDPEGVGLGYFRMASYEWNRQDMRAARACYQRALSFMPGIANQMASQLSAIVLQLQGAATTSEPLSEGQVRAALAARDIAIAPTEEVSDVFFEGMRASLDAEIFPVAREFMTILGLMTHDDVYYGMLRSIEDEPDR